VKFSFGSSFLTNSEALQPRVRLGNELLAEGDSRIVIPQSQNEAELVIEALSLEIDEYLRSCDLLASSVLRLTVDLDCSGFGFRELLRSFPLPKSGTFQLADELFGSIPRAVVAEGFGLAVRIVAVEAERSTSRGCSVRGGVLGTWQARVVPRNRVSMFPVQDSIEPGLWRLDIDVDDLDDLDRPLRSAVRLYVDSTSFDHLIGHDTDPSAGAQAIAWLHVEAFTAVAVHVLSNSALRDELSQWLTRIPPVERSLEPKSVGHFFVRVLRTIGIRDLADLHRRYESDPVETLHLIRSRLAPAIGGNSRTRAGRRV
jgi:hypothetical protein